MAIADEIQRIKTNIANAYTELENKGATIPEVKNSENLSNTITTVSSGGSGGGSTITKGIIVNACDDSGYATDISIVGMSSIPNYYIQEKSETRHSAIGQATNINFDDTLTSIGNYAFEYHNYLESVTIPKNVTNIGKYAFNYCKGNKRLEILSEGALTIDNRAFAYNTKLNTIIIHNPTPPTLSVSATEVFYYTGLTYNTGSIYVPDEAVETYKNATNWTSWSGKIKPMSELPTE